ncbi:MAG: hypoxanthine phosphoribosyltransferase [Desulfovibrio sp.]|jgi:hypoxanthine phosphoribosyltransferase|nr:hypoxanthine phosphoribosyltransferase [Desulfovibrio sp.]
MDEIRVKVIFDRERIATRIKELAVEIDACYGQEPLLAVCVLKGAVFFFGDLVRILHNKNLELDFVRLTSYGMDNASSGAPILIKDVEADIYGKHILIVEDIVDSGYSMRFLLDCFAARGARSLRLAALVDKHERRQVDVNVDFAGFAVNSGFLVGYGMDWAERWRMLPDICEIVPG